ncbi:MAG: FctA domain-containing protein, partial [Ruminococcus sp.]|nr:FctA domain-containing protein [Ruminococcus sp.]
SGITPPALSKVTVLNQKVELPVDIEAQKAAEGFALKGEDFAFTLKGTGVSQTKKNDAQGNVKFDTITFEVRSDDKATGSNTIVIKPDQFTDDKYTAEYTIAETAGNNAFLTYDGTEYKATVTVTRTPRSDVEGLYTYAAAVDYGNATNTPPAFTNSWKKAPARIIKKVLDSDGKPYDTNETFKIDITYTYPADYTGDTTQFPASVSLNKANGFTATINDLPYNTGVAVNEADSKGMTPSYDPASKQITVDGTSTAENPVTITVTNKRQAPGTTSFPVQFKKQFNYGTLEADAFEFEMLEGDGLKGDKVKNTAQGVVDFGTVNVEYSKTAKDPANKTVYLDDSKFTDDIATLTYKAKEVNGKKANIFYDGDEITYTVKIKRTVTAAQTTLEFVSGTYAKGKDNAESDTFVNNCLGDIKITKEVRNAADAEKAKPFKADVEIALMKADGTLSEFAAIPYIYTYEGGKTEATTTLDLYDGRVYTLSGLPMGSQVKVTEQSAKYPNYSVTYDPQIVTVGETASTAKVINTLQAPGQVTLGVNKTFTQDALNAGVDLEAKGNKFSFTMTAEANNPVLKDYTSTVTLDKYQDGKLVTSGEFAAIVFPPEYAYGQGTDVAFKVVENSAIEGNDGSIIYDTATYSVVYTVKQGESGLDISAPVITKSKNGDTSAPGTVSFENGYPVGSVEIKKLVKDFDGANLE